MGRQNERSKNDENKLFVTLHVFAITWLVFLWLLKPWGGETQDFFIIMVQRAKGNRTSNSLILLIIEKSNKQAVMEMEYCTLILILTANS